MRQRTASCHHLSLPECLAWILHAYPDMRQVRFRLWGIEPASLAPSNKPSAAVAAAIPLVADEVLGALANQQNTCD